MRGALVDRCDRCGALLVKMHHVQHAIVQAVYEDLSAQLDFPAGSRQMLEPEEWHQIMVAAYAKEKGWKQKMLPALDGDGFVMVMRQKQSRLTKRQGDELIEFARAYATGRGAELREWDEDGNLIAPRRELRAA